jgi:hypothetical protein
MTKSGPPQSDSVQLRCMRSALRRHARWVLLGGLSAIPPEKARLVAAAVEYHAEEVIGRGPVLAG